MYSVGAGFYPWVEWNAEITGLLRMSEKALLRVLKRELPVLIEGTLSSLKKLKIPVNGKATTPDAFVVRMARWEQRFGYVDDERGQQVCIMCQALRGHGYPLNTKHSYSCGLYGLRDLLI